MDTLVTAHLRLGDIVVLLFIVLALFAVFYGLGSLALRPRRSPMGRLSKRVAAGTIVRGLGGRLGSVGRFDRWN